MAEEGSKKKGRQKQAGTETTRGTLEAKWKRQLQIQKGKAL